MAKPDKKIAAGEEIIETTPPTPEQKILETRKRLVRIREAITRHIVSIADLAAGLKDVDVNVEILMRDCGFSDEEIPTFLKFSKEMEGYRDVILNHGLNFDAIRALVKVDAAVRKSAIMDIIADRSVSHLRILNTAARLDRNRLPLEQKIHDSSKEAFRNAFSKKAKDTEQALREMASSLYLNMIKYRRLSAYTRRTPEKYQFLSSSSRYSWIFAVIQGLKEKIVNLSQVLKSEISSVFGDTEQPIETWAALSRTDQNAAFLAQAQHSLEIMSRGHFDRWLPGEETRDYSWSSLHAIKFISAIPVPVKGRRARWLDPKLVKKLNAFELCAGTGSQALGVEAAGFYMHGLVDNDIDAISRMKKNRDKWNVISWDITKSPNKADTAVWLSKSKRLSQLDLVSGPLPIGPWRYRGDGKGELLFSTSNVIEVLNPNAFFLETDLAYQHSRHYLFRSKLTERFNKLGYSFTEWNLNVQKFGYAQERDRVYLVGIKTEYAAKLTAPTLDLKPTLAKIVLKEAFHDLSEYSRYVWLRGGNGTPELSKMSVAKLKEARSAAQVEYDDWAVAWLKTYGNGLAPDVNKHGYKPTGKSSTAWLKAGFNPMIKRLPQVGDVLFKSKKKKDPKNPGGSISTYEPALLPITFPLIRALQGIPEDWYLGEDDDSRLRELCKARPPIMGLAIARHIHQAISGQSVNLSDPAAREVTSGRNRSIPNLLVGGENHPDPMQLKAKRWAAYQINKMNGGPESEYDLFS